jgi:hypothetical protein
MCEEISIRDNTVDKLQTSAIQYEGIANVATNTEQHKSFDCRLNAKESSIFSSHSVD